MVRPRTLSLAVVLVVMGVGHVRANPIGYTIGTERGQRGLYSIDLATGAINNRVGTISVGNGFTPFALTFAGNQLYTLGFTTGTNLQLRNLTPMLSSGPAPTTGVAVTGAGGRIGGLDYDPTTGQMYAVIPNIAGETQLFRLNPATGVATSAGSPTGQPYSDDLAVNQSGVAYTADALFWPGTLYGIGLGNGSLTPTVPDLGLLGDENSGLAFDPAGNLWLLTTSGTLFRVNPITGLSNLANTLATTNTLSTGSFYGFTVAPALGVTDTPEPSMLAVCGLLSVAAGMAARRRKRLDPAN